MNFKQNIIQYILVLLVIILLAQNHLLNNELSNQVMRTHELAKEANINAEKSLETIRRLDPIIKQTLSRAEEASQKSFGEKCDKCPK